MAGSDPRDASRQWYSRRHRPSPGIRRNCRAAGWALCRCLTGDAQPAGTENRHSETDQGLSPDRLLEDAPCEDGHQQRQHGRNHPPCEAVVSSSASASKIK